MLEQLRPLFPYLKKYRGSYLLGTICVFFNNGVWILFPLVIGRAINDLTRHTITGHRLMIHALSLLAVAATKGIFQFLTRWIVIGRRSDWSFVRRILSDAHAKVVSLYRMIAHSRHASIAGLN